MTATTTTPERVLKIREVANHLGCTDETVYRLVRENRLRSIRVGRLLRVPASALDDFIAGR